MKTVMRPILCLTAFWLATSTTPSFAASPCGELHDNARLSDVRAVLTCMDNRLAALEAAPANTSGRTASALPLPAVETSKKVGALKLDSLGCDSGVKHMVCEVRVTNESRKDRDIQINKAFLVDSLGRSRKAKVVAAKGEGSSYWIRFDLVDGGITSLMLSFEPLDDGVAPTQVEIEVEDKTADFTKTENLGTAART